MLSGLNGMVAKLYQINCLQLSRQTIFGTETEIQFT